MGADEGGVNPRHQLEDGDDNDDAMHVRRNNAEVCAGNYPCSNINPTW